MSKENRVYFESLLSQVEPYPDGASQLDLDATDGDTDRLNASFAAELLRQDDEARKEAGLKNGEFLK